MDKNNYSTKNNNKKYNNRRGKKFNKKGGKFKRKSNVSKKIVSRNIIKFKIKKDKYNPKNSFTATVHVEHLNEDELVKIIDAIRTPIYNIKAKYFSDYLEYEKEKRKEKINKRKSNKKESVVETANETQKEEKNNE